MSAIFQRLGVHNRTQASVVLRADALLVQLQGGQTLLALAEGETPQMLPMPGPPRTAPMPPMVANRAVFSATPHWNRAARSARSSALSGAAKVAHRLRRPVGALSVRRANGNPASGSAGRPAGG